MANSLKVKNFFFDRAAIIKAMDAGALRSLSKIGAFLRTRARSGMRRRKATALPGQPPSVHEGSLKNRLYFSYDPTSKSVVVGSERFKSDAPNIQEFGGEVTLVRRGVKKRAVVRPHPYMGPALAAEIEAGTIPNAFKDCLHG